MSYTIRGRRVGYDNIASGSASGREKTAVGTSGKVSGPSEYLGGGSNVKSGTTVNSTDAVEHIISVSGGYSTLPTNERP